MRRRNEESDTILPLPDDRHPDPSASGLSTEGRNIWRAGGTRLKMDLKQTEREVLERVVREREKSMVMTEHEDDDTPSLEDEEISDGDEFTPAREFWDNDNNRSIVTGTLKGTDSQKHSKKCKSEASSETGVDIVKNSKQNGFIRRASMTRSLIFLTELLVVGSVVGLALLTAGSLMFGGAVITIATGVPLVFSMAFLISPLFVSFSPVPVVVGTGIFLSACGLLLLVAFGFFLYSLVLWIVDYAAGRDPPGSREIAAVNNRLRDVYVHVVAYSGQRYLELKTRAAEYYQSVKTSANESAELFKLTFKVLGLGKEKNYVIMIKKPTEHTKR